MGTYIAKPRKVKVEGGVVLINGYPKDLANELEVYISRFKKSELLIAAGTSTIEEAEEVRTFPDKAIAIKEVFPGHWELVMLGYDIETKEAVIEDSKYVASFKQEATNKFMQEMYNRGLV